MDKKYLFVSLAFFSFILIVSILYLNVSSPFKRFYEKTTLTPYLLRGIRSEEEFIEIISQRQVLIETYGKRSPDQIKNEIENLYRYYGTTSTEIKNYNEKYKFNPDNAFLIAKRIKTRITQIKTEHHLR